MYLKPKKSLGQNFLVDKNIQRKIVSACALSKEDIILEIGAGMGDLTEQLAVAAKRVYTLEIDRRLFPVLEQRLREHTNCQLLKESILKFDIDKFLEEDLIKQKIKVVGNIPYYISSPIIEHLVEYRANIDTVFMTVQKEFGRRVNAVAGSKEYGSFSCFVQYYAQSKIIFEIKKGSFSPRPKVDSCLLSLKFRQEAPVKVKDEGLFFKLIRSAFNQRRKTLRNSLADFITLGSLEPFLDREGLDRNVRPEDLTLDKFARLSNSIDSAKDLEVLKKNQKRS
ncbi:MAG: 16S rRNA (adenine(1518)-N(6)/adenine(1519)-N(6))-dimethyltransferase RsmA [Candidatus Omnitrophica bacterium]|nr:16S rRNA (adenine(1518)-N(6)/adenine(1519)-N(6))-dimethyltransferase RsmA [Candidatus Omnitrophota bacterium]MDD5691022.1 16S rRNA (adenine(1518)-N(6)/adenine(1519)-N(6))-dimethyltransferase RsmA [Candidatus Omnitrophota bacterium]